MIKKVHRNVFKNIFLNLQKEETWLNKMCKDGYALKEISNGYYIFEECNPSEYVYRIEFLKNSSKNEDKISYLSFMQEMNVALIASIGRWHYFRRKSCLGEFNIYSDIDSIIKHYKRINVIWYILSFIFIFGGVSQTTSILQNIFDGTLNISYIISVAFILIGIYFLILSLPLKKKIAQLQKEKILHE